MSVSGVRLARASDADGVADVNVRSWRQRFTQTLPAQALDALDASDLALVWAGAVINPPTRGHRLLVAVEGDVVLGYAAIGPSQDPDADPQTIELLALEVDPEHQREGHGSRLMAAAMDHAVGAGMTTAATWCPLDDEARRAFLLSSGWGPDTALRDILVGADADGSDLLVREARLVTDLA
ncbi:MAG: GNAT family N-acetyltransferase [Actinobacteria bacterium]|nr:GNAT family N-acetyltransferase [Actinomycetota bacterium]